MAAACADESEEEEGQRKLVEGEGQSRSHEVRHLSPCWACGRASDDDVLKGEYHACAAGALASSRLAPVASRTALERNCRCCHQSMLALVDTVQAGLARFRAGDFLAAHDAWEKGWRAAQGAERHLLQALVQLAAAFHQWKRSRPRGAATLFARARGHLEAIPSTLLGVEVSELELELEAWEEAPPTSPALRALKSQETSAGHAHRPRCPYCGERVTVQADAVGVAEESYVEDCPVCCRPWTVRVSRSGDGVDVALGRDDD